MDVYSKILLSLFLINGLAVIAGALKVAIDARKSLNAVIRRNESANLVVGEITASSAAIAALRD